MSSRKPGRWDELNKLLCEGREHELMAKAPCWPFLDITPVKKIAEGVWFDKTIPIPVTRDSWDALRHGCVMGYIGMPRWKEAAPEHIIFNGITTVCIFQDGTKVISRPKKGERFDKETGVAMCIAKYIYGSRSKFLKAVNSGHEPHQGSIIKEHKNGEDA